MADAVDEAAEHEAVIYVTFTTTTADARECLYRSGLTVGSLIGETLVTDIELVHPQDD